MVREAAMKNPLRKRVLRELRDEWHKYTVIFVFMTVIIGAVSGMYVANGSMSAELEKQYDKYVQEDAHFELDRKAGGKLIKDIEKGKKGNVLRWMREEAYSEVDAEVEKIASEEVRKEVEKAVNEELSGRGIIDTISDSEKEELVEKYYKRALKSADYKDALSDAKVDAHKEADKEIDKEYKKLEDELGLASESDAVPGTVYELFYKDVAEHSENEKVTDGEVRVYRLSDRENIDKICLMEGRFPEKNGEILIDRMHADNADISIGDSLTLGEDGSYVYTVVGVGAFSDYSTLFKDNTDIMFDAIGFDTAVVTDEDFDSIDSRCHYNYAVRYAAHPDDDVEAREMSDALMGTILTNSLIHDRELKGYVPAYINQAMNFAYDDIEDDMAMSGILLYIFIAVLAFVFAVTTSSTITREATVIGTLRASGYTRDEITRHYMTMPVIVTVISAMVGNILGYTWLKGIAVATYYNSYSLPTYTTVWSAEAFLKTTIIPIVMMVIINLIVISSKLRLSPLRFLRKDLKKKKSKKAVRLPRFSFMGRFRLRIILQNIPDYLVLFAGLGFVTFLLAFSVGVTDTLSNYAKHADEMMFANYQTVLMDNKDEDENVITTDAKGAERFAMTDLLMRTKTHDESVSVYGTVSKSRYVDIPDLEEGHIYISSALEDKYSPDEGDVLTFSEKYENKDYEFTVDGVFDYDGGVAIFMNLEDYNSIFGEDDDYFNAFLSDEEVTDIDSDLIAVTMTSKDITKVVDQLQHSMGGMMDIFQWVCAILAAALIYLLTKVIIEKNENAISMIKILGFKNSEISSLYVLTTTIVVAVAVTVMSFFGVYAMGKVWDLFMLTMDGYFGFYITFVSVLKMLGLIFAAYLVVMLIDMGRISRIRMDEALKNVE